jgi:Bacteriophage CI repressor helix-turn-helix domain
MAAETGDFGVSETENDDFGVHPSNPEILERAARLRQAVAEAGGNKAAARRAGVPLGTLNNYLAGRDLKVQALIALAEATGVCLEWLATGHGPMRPGAVESSPAEEAVQPVTAIDIDRLTAAIERATELYDKFEKRPTPRRFARILSIIYDDITADARDDAAPPPHTKD